MLPVKIWRPKEWVNPCKAVYLESINTGHMAEAFELGADAMLEALFKMARESPTGEFVIDSKIYNC